MQLNTPQYRALRYRRPQHEPLTSLRKVHVLILDNSPQVTDLFVKILKELGFTNLFPANSGAHGVQIMRQVKMHLIVTDFELRAQRRLAAQVNESPLSSETLPLSGIDFVRRLRQSPYSPNPFIPVIMLTEPVQPAQITAARDSGVNEIITKPLQSRDLCLHICNIIEKPRIFITAENYKGPCRRRRPSKLPPEKEQRRREIKLVKCDTIRCYPSP